jgi:hypothetical protein
VEACVRRRAFHYEAVLSLLRDEPTPPLARRLDLAQRPELAGLAEEVRPSSLYDQLRPSAVDGEVAA